MTLPVLPPPTLFDLELFDVVHGAPIALRVLARRLGWLEAARALGRVAWRTVAADPLAALPPPESEAERLSRRQFRPVAVLDRVLRDDLGLAGADAIALLGDVVRETGARFIGRTVPFPSRGAWRGAGMGDRERFASQAAHRFFNADLSRIDATDHGVDVDVKGCRFVRLAREIGRPELSALFCEADSVFFGRPDAPVRLRRAGTIARGAPICDFRFRYE